MGKIGRVVWIDSTRLHGELVARVGLRMVDGSRKNCYFRDVKPWGYVHEDASLPDRKWIVDVESGYESIFDDSLKRVTTTLPEKVNTNRNDNDVLVEYVDEHFESDIPFYRKLAIIDGISGHIELPSEPADVHDDKEIYEFGDVNPDPDFNEEIPPRVAIADIEVAVSEEESFEETRENASQPINVICCYDTYEEEYTAFFYDEYNSLENAKEIRGIVEGQFPNGTDNLPKHTFIETVGLDDIQLSISETEEAMLADFSDYILERGFDLISGWNFSDFDYEYLINRMEELDETDSAWLSPFGKCGYANNDAMQIRGLPSFDMMTALCDKMSFHGWRSKSLDYVSREEIGVGKVEDVDINESWKNNSEKLVGYNIVDVALSVALDQSNDIHSFFYEMGDVSAIPIYDTFYEKRLVDGFVMSRREENEILPSSSGVELIENAGGYVADAVDGRKKNVGVSDLKSLYPSAIITWNISTETIAETPEEFDEYVRVPKVPEPKDVHGKIEEEQIDMDWLYCSLDQEGLIPRTLKLLFQKRNREKERMYNAETEQEEDKWDRKQGATKVLMNSFYGVSSSKYWRLSNEYLGDAVTSTARYTLWKGEQTIERLGYEHVYSDSVTGDRTVVVKDPENNIRCLPIEEIWEESTLFVSGRKETGELDGWKALSVSEDGQEEWRCIHSIIRHETEKEILELQHSKGSSITTTDHSYVIEENGEFVERQPREIEKPYRVNVPNEEDVEEIDILEYIDDHSFVGNSIGRGTNMVEKKVRTFGDKLFHGEEEGGSRKRTSYVKRYVKNEEDLKSLLRLCGAYISDGSASTFETTDSRWGVSISNSDVEWLEQLQEDYYRLFDSVKCSIIESDVGEIREVNGYSYNDDTYKMQCMNRISASVFSSLCGITSEGKKIPQFAFNLPDEYKEILVDALVKGDGSRKFKRYSDEYCENNFDYTTKSSELCSGLSVILNQIDKKHFIGYREDKGTYSIRTCEDYHGKENDATVIQRDSGRYVYDLSVEENHNFVEGMGGILLHNTDSHMFILTADSPKDRVRELFDVSEEMDSDASEIAEDIGIEGKHPFLKDSNLHGDDYTCMKWEAEAIFESFMQLGTKKRYAGNLEWEL